MAETKIEMQLHNAESKDNGYVTIKVTNEGRNLCNYMELLNNYQVSVDVLLDSYFVVSAAETTMKSIAEYYDFLSSEINKGDVEFLLLYVKHRAEQFARNLKDMVFSPVMYVKELVGDRKMCCPVTYTSCQMSDAVVELFNQFPVEVSVGIMGAKIADALRFIPGMLEWKVEFPQMEDIVREMLLLAYTARYMVKQELDKMPAEAQNENNPMFFVWWHLDDAIFQLDTNINEFVKLVL